MNNYRYYRPNRYLDTKKSKRSSTVLFDFYDWDITLREVIFSILIIGVMSFIGFLISSKIDGYINSNKLIYRQAPAISTNDEFKHALRTDLGNAFVHGTIKAKDVVTHPHVKGEYLSILVDRQIYQMHTQVYTTTDSKGRIHTHTRHYWSWDTVSTQEFHSKEVEYCGVTFPYEKFNYGIVERNNTTYKEHGWSNKREVIYTKPTTFNATIFGNLMGNDIEGSDISLSNRNIEEYRKEMADSYLDIIFWIVWVIFMIGLVILFYVIDNDWLEG